MIFESLITCLAFICGFVAAGFSVLFLHSRALGPSDNSQGRELAGSIAFRIASIYAIVLGLVFSAANSQFSDAQQNVQEQSISIGKAYTLLELYDGPQARQIQQDLTQVAEQSLVELESENVGISPLTQVPRLYLRLLRSAFELRAENELQKELRRSFINRMEELRDLRAKRYAATWGQATAGFWIFVLVGFAAIAFCFGAYIPNVRRHCYMTLFFMFVGFSAFFIYELSRPYAGSLRVSGHAFQEVTQVLREFDGQRN